MCIVYPNTYYIGMSNLAVHLLYRTLNDLPWVVCERYFLDGSGHAASLEGQRPLASFDILFFSLSYELDYLNIPRILAAASIPVTALQREAGTPLVVGGGVCVMANPEPISAFFDLFLMGDVEATVPLFMDQYQAMRGKDRPGLVHALGSPEWVYNPAMLEVSYNEAGQIAAFKPEGFAVNCRYYREKGLATSSITTSETEFSDMYLIEGTRGCPSRCPFCLMGNVYPFRYDTIAEADTEMGHVGIVGGGVSFHPEITETVKRLKASGKSVHFPSLRIDEVPLSVIEVMEDEIKTLTFGIEAGTERLRSFLGKPLQDREIFEKIEAILRIKPFNLKLYFMIGIYGEEGKDVEAIFHLTKQIKHLMVKTGARRGFVGTITVHVSPFVPKAVTPFQWLPMAEMDNLKSRINWLRKAFHKVDNTYFTHESVKFSSLQGILARADRRVNDVIIKLAQGISFQKILRENPVNLNFYLLRKRAEKEVFPWDFIGGSTSKRQLYKRLATAIDRAGSHGDPPPLFPH